MNNIKMPEDVRNWLDRGDRKTKLKKIGVGLACAATCIVGYKVGRRVEFGRCIENMGTFIYSNPDLRKEYVKAVKNCSMNTLN